jgi:4-hydroxybenzoate polyprenyltransferase
VTTIPNTRPTALRYLACLRPQDIAVLQGSPLLGAAFAMRQTSDWWIDALLTLVVANIFLVSHIFMLNDWAGHSADLADPNKSARVFTARGVGHREIVVLTAGLLVLSLLLFTYLGALTFGIAAAIAVLSGLYSLPRFHWKSRPFFNSFTHLAGGILHFLLGYSIAGTIDGRGVAIATFFALIFVAGHLTQEVRDSEGDAANAIRTNAVAFGPRRTFIASLVLFTLAHVLLITLALERILPRPLAALAVLCVVQLHWSLQTLRAGLTFANVSRLQTRYRALYAVMGVVMVAVLVTALRM